MSDPGRGGRSAAISTDRLLVRRFRTGDLPDFLEYQGHPLVREHQPGDAMSAEDAERFVAAQVRLEPTARGAWHGFVVEHLGDRRVIGDVGIWLPAEADAPVVGDLGFQLDPRHHGLGYAREALQAFLPIAFRTFALDRVTASCDAANASSWGLMERLGLRLLTERDGRRQYGALRAEWVGADDRPGR